MGTATASQALLLKERATAGPGRAIQILVFLAVSLLAVALRLHWSAAPLECDEATYLLIGREVVHGELPQVTAWSMRPPAVGLFYSLAVAAAPSRPEVQRNLMGVANVLLTLAGVFLLIRSGESWSVAALGMLIFAMASSDPSMEGYHANTEFLVNTFATWSFACLAWWLRRRSFPILLAAGFLMGLAGAAKELAIVFFIGQVILVFRSKVRARDLAVLITVCGIPWAATLVTYAATHHFDLIRDTFAFNAGYPALSLKDLAYGPLLFLFNPVAFFGTWPLWVVAIVHLCNPNMAGSRSVAMRCSIVYLVAAVIAVIVPGKAFSHYYLLCLPPLAAVSAIAVARTRSAYGVLAIAFVFAVQLRMATGRMPLLVKQQQRTNEASVLRRTFGLQLGASFPSARSLVVYGIDPEIYLYSGLRPATPVFWNADIDKTFFGTGSILARRIYSRAVAPIQTVPPDIVVMRQFPRELGIDGPFRRFLIQMAAEQYSPLPLDAWWRAHVDSRQPPAAANIAAVWVRNDLVPGRHR